MTCSIENVLAQLKCTGNRDALDIIPTPLADGTIQRRKNFPGPKRKKKRAASAHAIRILAAQRSKWKRKRQLKIVAPSIKSKDHSSIYIQSSQNNTIYTLTTSKKQPRYWVSAGRCGFKNSRKSTSYASQSAAARCAEFAKNHNVHRVNLFVNGLGPGRLTGVRALGAAGLVIGRIRECTNLPHNGCRPPNKRRV